MKLDAKDLHVDGFPILKQALETGPVVLQTKNEFRGCLRFCAIATDGQVVVQFEASAIGTGGTSEIRISAALEAAPLQTSIVLRFAKGKPSKVIEFSFDVRLKRWVGKRILHLPYFDDLLKLFRSIRDGSRLRIDCLWEGNVLFGGTVSKELLVDWLAVLPFMETYQKAREIARKFGVNPLLPDDLTEYDLAEIDFLHWSMVPGVRSRGGSDAHFNVILSNLNLDALQIKEENHFKISSPDETVDFLREKLAAGPIEYELSHAVLAQSKDELAELMRVNAEAVPLEISGSRRSILTIHRMTH